MHTIFHTTITQIGGCARDALLDNMLITFREGAPADIEEFCFIHRHGATAGEPAGRRRDGTGAAALRHHRRR